ncbi:GLPGLI family protein [Flagellimonas lutaonensis]|uniref:GLPGLI family protein n=1 Tax=Flagellimonas lutaonensis TaxID=516051 RepID=A0A0D5YUB4_9FLAO|nr:GLPGLI family protein [Allomuricauda lutaonensis]AKA35479.1 hypothetical protein VC82_1874 [Allomuricauda lutaonensis]
MRNSMAIKTIFFISILLCFPTLAEGQESKGHVVYRMKYQPFENNNAQNFSFTNKKEKIVTAIYEIKAELFFDEHRSIYKIRPNLELENDFSHKIAKIIAGGVWYKNLKTKSKIERINSMGEEINVIRDFKTYDWHISTEEKMIGNFKTFKASTSFKEKNNFTKKDEDFEITAWFCPQISASFGPKGIDGLPGLVLEATINNRITLFATEIDLQAEFDLSTLEKPKGGIDMTEEKFNKIRKERYSSKY